MTQKKMENGSKLLISDFIFRNRYFLSFLTIIVFLLSYGFSSYASTYELSDMTLFEYYGIDSPISFTRDGITSQISDPSKLDSRCFRSTGSVLPSSLFDGSGVQGFKFLSSYNSNTIDFNNCKHLFSYGGDKARSFMIVEGGSPVYIVNYDDAIRLYSFDSFSYYECICFDDGSININTEAPSVWSFNWGDAYVANINTADFIITDCPLNISTTDSSSGFSSFNDYNLNNVSSYLDFNYLINDGLITPDAPNNPSSVPSDAKHYLNNSLTTKYEKGNNGLKIWEYWTFNDYVRTHPSEFLVSYDWTVYFHDGSNIDPTIRTYSSSFQGPLYQVMLNGNNFDSKMVVDRSFRDFVNGQFTLQGALDHVVTEVSGTLTNYQTDMQAFGGTDSIGLKIDDKYEYSYEQPKGIDTFYIVGVYRLIASDGTPSGVFTDRYDFLNGSYEILANEIVNNFDPPSSDMLPSTISPSSGLPSSNNYNAPVVNGGRGGNVVVYNNGGLSPAFQIDDVNIANVAQTMNDVVSFFGDDRNQNGFWSLMKSVYDYLPAEIWTAIAVGVSTVLGISIVKVTLSYVRK